MQFRDLAEHVGAVVALLGVFACLAGFLFWRILARLEKKLDQLHEATHTCRAGLAERFVSRAEFRKEKDDLWGAVNAHAHDLKGRVVR